MRHFIEMKTEGLSIFVDPDSIDYAEVRDDDVILSLKGRPENLEFDGENMVKLFLEQWEEYLQEQIKK